MTPDLISHQIIFSSQVTREQVITLIPVINRRNAMQMEWSKEEAKLYNIQNHIKLAGSNAAMNEAIKM